MPLNFGPPLIDFSPLGQLGETYDRSVKRAHEAQIAANREKALAGFGQNGDLAALGNTLLRAGDLEGGMSALRMAQAGQGTPWQREQAAKEDAYRARQEDENRRRYEEAKERADRPEFISQPRTNEFGDPLPPREGRKMPDGTVIWNDQRPPPVIGPQSGGLGDPNLPAPNSMQAAGQLAAEPNPNDYGVPTPNPARERGYVIPGTLEGFPHGTVRMPRDPDAPAPRGAPAQATLPAPAVAGPIAVPAPPQQAPAAPLAPPAVAGPTAVAAPAAATPAAPITATQINQGTTNIAPMTNAEMIAEARRVGITPGQYRDARAAAIKKEMEAKTASETQTTDMKNKLARARRTAQTVDRELDALDKDVKEYGVEFMPGTVKTRMNTTYTNLLMQLKEMYELGALQAHDIEMVKGLLSNPTAVDPVEGAARSFFQKAITAQQVAKLKQIVKDGMRAAEESLGGDPSRVAPSADPRLEKPLDVGGSRELGGGVTITRVK